MTVPSYGALPLAKFFLLVRGLTIVAMAGIVGMTANFVSEIVAMDLEPPREVVGALSVVSRAVPVQTQSLTIVSRPVSPLSTVSSASPSSTLKPT